MVRNNSFILYFILGDEELIRPEIQVPSGFYKRIFKEIRLENYEVWTT